MHREKVKDKCDGYNMLPPNSHYLNLPMRENHMELLNLNISMHHQLNISSKKLSIKLYKRRTRLKDRNSINWKQSKDLYECTNSYLDSYMDALGVYDSSLDHVHHHQKIGMNQENVCAPWRITQSFKLRVPAQKIISIFKIYL